MSSNTEWTRRNNPDREQWELLCEGKKIYGYVSNYADDSDSWSWQAVRGEHRLCELVFNRDEAMRCAEDALALPIPEFNQLVLKDLLADLSVLVKKIETLTVTTKEVSDEHA